MLCTSNSSSERRFRCEYSPSYFIYDNEDDSNPYKEIEYNGIKFKIINRAYGRKKAEEFEKMLRETYLKEKEIRSFKNSISNYRSAELYPEFMNISRPEKYEIISIEKLRRVADSNPLWLGI